MCITSVCMKAGPIELLGTFCPTIEIKINELLTSSLFYFFCASQTYFKAVNKPFFFFFFFKEAAAKHWLNKRIGISNVD